MSGANVEGVGAATVDCGGIEGGIIAMVVEVGVKQIRASWEVGSGKWLGEKVPAEVRCLDYCVWCMDVEGMDRIENDWVVETWTRWRRLVDVPLAKKGIKVTNSHSFAFGMAGLSHISAYLPLRSSCETTFIWHMRATSFSHG